MKLKRSSGDERAAFTLVEIMIVVVLIGIMTVLIIPEMKGTYEDALLRSTSRELINAFKLAYSRSVSFNQAHRVRLDTGNGRYVVEKQVLDRSGETFAPLRDVPGGEGTLDKRITIAIHKAGAQAAMEAGPQTAIAAPDESPAPPATDITFYPDGTAEAGEIVLQDRQGYRLALRINPTTARVRIVELARE
jgi:type II secretion system protein H